MKIAKIATSRTFPAIRYALLANVLFPLHSTSKGHGKWIVADNENSLQLYHYLQLFVYSSLFTGLSNLTLFFIGYIYYTYTIILYCTIFVIIIIIVIVCLLHVTHHTHVYEPVVWLYSCTAYLRIFNYFPLLFPLRVRTYFVRVLFSFH